MCPTINQNMLRRLSTKRARMAKMIKDSEIIVLNVMEEIPIPPVIFETGIRHHKTGEPTTLSTYLRDLQTDMRYKMVNTLEEVKKKYKNSAASRRRALRLITGASSCRSGERSLACRASLRASNQQQGPSVLAPPAARAVPLAQPAVPCAPREPAIAQAT